VVAYPHFLEGSRTDINPNKSIEPMAEKRKGPTSIPIPIPYHDRVVHPLAFLCSGQKSDEIEEAKRGKKLRGKRKFTQINTLSRLGNHNEKISED
jgi:hypothetical protein